LLPIDDLEDMIPAMSIDLNLEVDFHEQDRASFLLESNSSGNDEKIGEVALFTLFAIRQLSNLGQTDAADSLAHVLTTAPQGIEQLADGKTQTGLKIVPYPGHQGRKRFLARLRFGDASTRFDLKAKGFGWLASGVGYYAPAAVLGLLTHLALKRCRDQQYLASLSEAAALSGKVHLDRQISLSNQGQLALAILAHTCSTDYPSERAS
jgi:hypothetical protein